VPTTLSSDVNVHHLHDFSAEKFRRMFVSNALRIVDELTQIQRFSPLRLRKLAGHSERSYRLRPRLGRYYARHPGILLRRLWTTMRHGFANHYLVLVGRKS
jgi:hypothetical protein